MPALLEDHSSPPGTSEVQAEKAAPKEAGTRGAGEARLYDRAFHIAWCLPPLARKKRCKTNWLPFPEPPARTGGRSRLCALLFAASETEDAASMSGSYFF